MRKQSFGAGASLSLVVLTVRMPFLHTLSNTNSQYKRRPLRPTNHINFTSSIVDELQSEYVKETQYRNRRWKIIHITPYHKNVNAFKRWLHRQPVCYLLSFKTFQIWQICRNTVETHLERDKHIKIHYTSFSFKSWYFFTKATCLDSFYYINSRRETFDRCSLCLGGGMMHWEGNSKKIPFLLSVVKLEGKIKSSENWQQKGPEGAFLDG